MLRELVIDGARFTDFDGFVAEFNRVYLPAFGGPLWNGETYDLHELLEAAAETTGEPLRIRWINSQQSRTHLGYEQMAELCTRQMAGIPEAAFSPGGYALVHGWAQERFEQARAGEGKTLFEWLFWQLDGDGDGIVELVLEG